MATASFESEYVLELCDHAKKRICQRARTQYRKEIHEQFMRCKRLNKIKPSLLGTFLGNRFNSENPYKIKNAVETINYYGARAVIERIRDEKLRKIQVIRTMALSNGKVNKYITLSDSDYSLLM